MKKFRVLILQNIISPYKTLLFNALREVLNMDFKILYLAETEGNREWRIDKNEIKFAFDVMFKGKIDNISPIKMAIETCRKLNLYDPKIVIIGGYSYLAYWAAVIWAKKNKRKVIAIIESHYLDKPRIKFKEWVKRLFVSNCDAALVDGSRHRDYVISLGLTPEKIFIKGGTGPVDVDFYQREVAKYKDKKTTICDKFDIKTRNFLYIGRFSPEKNIIFLLSAYKKLKDEGINWGLILVGNGPQREEINEFIRKNNIKDVFMPGFKQKEEIPEYLAISDVFILPSISEPWGLVVNEAMAAGLPVLVSKKCGCYPDLIKEGVNGFSFDPDNENELHSLMKNVVMGKYDLESMCKVSLDIIKEYTPERAAKVIVDTINFVLGEK